MKIKIDEHNKKEKKSSNKESDPPKKGEKRIGWSNRKSEDGDEKMKIEKRDDESPNGENLKKLKKFPK